MTAEPSAALAHCREDSITVLRPVGLMHARSSCEAAHHAGAKKVRRLVESRCKWLAAASNL